MRKAAAFFSSLLHLTARNKNVCSFICLLYFCAKVPIFTHLMTEVSALVVINVLRDLTSRFDRYRPTF